MPESFASKWTACKNWVAAQFNRVLDFIFIWVMPALSMATLVFGALLTYDFAIERHEHPNWQGLFNLIQAHLLVSFITTAGATTLLTILDAIRNRSIRKLNEALLKAKERNAVISSNIKNLFDGTLYNLSKKLEFKEGEQSRISLYIHDGNGTFVPFGRYSKNPEYQKPGRPSYPDSQGCISKGWRNEWHFDNDFGNGLRHKNKNIQTYALNDNEYSNLKMKSALYAVKRIDDAMGNQLAVLVVESMDQNRFTESYIRDKLEGVVDDFARTILSVRDYIPDPQNASRRGL